MSTKIFEEDSTPVASASDAKKILEKRARQLAYDTRYQVKKETGGKKVDPNTMRSLLLRRLQKSTATPQLKARAKQMLLGEVYGNFAKDIASSDLAEAMFKVFVEGVEQRIDLPYLQELNSSPQEKFLVYVYDPKTKNSYTRKATTEKMTQLRLKGLKVEKTEHGTPREDEARKGAQTTRALGGGGTAKKGYDYDRDGKVESSSKEHAGVVHNAIQRAKGGVPDGKDTRKTVSASYEPEGEVIDEAGGRQGGGTIRPPKPGKLPVETKPPTNRGAVRFGTVDENLKSKKRLVGNQHRIDANKNGEIDAGDFKILRNEEFLADASDMNTEKITGKNVNNASLIKVFPDDGPTPNTKGPQSPKGVYAHTELEGEVLTEKAKSKAQQRFMAMVYARKKGKMEKGEASSEVEAAAEGMTKKDAKKYAKTKHKGLPEKVQKEEKENEGSCDSSSTKERDKRGDYAKIAMVKNKLRAMGVQNPIVMVATEQVKKGTDYLGRDAGGSEEEHASNVRFGKAMEKLQGAINPKPGSLSKGLIKPAN